MREKFRSLAQPVIGPAACSQVQEVIASLKERPVTDLLCLLLPARGAA